MVLAMQKLPKVEAQSYRVGHKGEVRMELRESLRKDYIIEHAQSMTILCTERWCMT